MTLPPAMLVEFVKLYGHEPRDDGEIELFIRTRAAQSAAGINHPAARPPTAPIGARVPAAVAVAIDGRVRHDKMWLEDAKKFKRGKPFSGFEWENEVRTKIGGARTVGDPSGGTLLFAAKQLRHEADRDGQGCVTIGMRFLGHLIGRCSETVRCVVRWLELQGLIFTRGTRVRDGKYVMNGENCYVLQRHDDVPQAAPPEPPPEDASVDAIGAALAIMRRMVQAADRWAPCFGLTTRPTGWLNRTPLRAEPNPRPA